MRASRAASRGAPAGGRAWVPPALGVFGAGLVAACSLVNEFPGVEQREPASTVSTVAITVTVAGGGGDGGAGGAAATGGAGSTGGAEPSETVLAVGGRFLGQEVLYALSATTGKALATEFATVAALAYDGEHDAYFVFLADTLPVKAGARGKVETRRFDFATSAWTVVGTVDGVLLPSGSEHVSLVRNRLAYLVPLAGGNTGVALLDVSNVESVSAVVPETVDVAGTGALRGLVGTRHPSGNGGFLHALREKTEGGSCRAELTKIEATNVGAKVQPTSFTVGPAFPCASSAGWAADPKALTHLISVPPEAGSGEATLLAVDPSSGQLVTTKLVTVASADSHELVPFAFAACAQVALLGTGAGEVVARSFTEALPVTLSVGTKLSGLAYEPRQRLLLARHAESEEVFSLRAIAVSGDCFAPELALLDASRWKAPVFLEPRHVAVGDPVPLGCKPGDCSL